MLLYLLAILVLPHIPTGDCVSVRLLVPEVVKAGGSAILVCQFDLRGQQLYSVKWYRGNFEFFRFIPKESPPNMAFPFPGINVDVPSSSAHQVLLLNIPANIGGRFSCEVSAEAPRFTTASDYADLHVIDVRGIRKPEISLSSHFYDRNNLEMLSINCSTHPTLPPPIVQFFINNVKVKAEEIEILNSGLATLSPKTLEPWTVVQCEPTAATNLNAIQELKPGSRKDVEIKANNDLPIWIRCEATLHQVYHLSSSDVPLFPQIDEPPEIADSGVINKIAFPVTYMFLLNCIIFFNVNFILP